MKVINRLTELHNIKKYSKYIDKELIPAINNLLHIELTPKLSVDPFTCIYEATKDELGMRRHIVFSFTTNRRDIDGIFWATVMISGRKDDIGSMTGDLKEDLDIIEDAYYFLLERLTKKGLI